MLTCNDANVLIVRTIDDSLRGSERAALRRHLASCASCRAEYETQHEVRRLLALHIHDRLPGGFDARLNARLARTQRPLPAAVPPWMAAEADATRVRTWALRLIPFAATVALIVASTSVRDDASVRPSVPGEASARTRMSTTVVLSRSDRTSRRNRPSLVSMPAASAPAEPSDEKDGRGAEAVAESVAGRDASAAAKLAPEPVRRASGTGDRTPVSEPREGERERVATRETGAGRERPSDARVEDERAEAERVDAERAASQRPGILPRPAAPIPQARPAILPP